MNLSVQVNGISFNTPIILASGYITETPSFFMEAIPHGCSAIVTRSLKKIVPDERKRVPVPRYAIIPGEDSMLNCEWGNEFGWDNWRDQWVRQVKDTGGPIIVSLSARDPEGCVQMIREFDQIGVDAYEINFSCSHSGALHGNLNVDFDHLASSMAVIRPATKTPIWVKLSYSPFVVGMARHAERHGADAIVCTNSIGPGLLIDTGTGYPKLGTQGGAGGLSGKAIFPIALRCVYEIARAVDIPTVGVGGICSSDDVLQMLMAGASAVQLYTYPALHGPSSLRVITNGLRDFLQENEWGLHDLSEFVGLTQSLANSHCFAGKSPTVQTARCTGCGRCETACLFGAMSIVPGKSGKTASISDKCISCNACAGMCPVGAITPNYQR